MHLYKVELFKREFMKKNYESIFLPKTNGKMGVFIAFKNDKFDLINTYELKYN